nr:anti-phage protein KwaB [uncultured Carboxylicivirga sp.]
MNLEELREKIETIVRMDAIGLNVFFLLKTAEGNILKRANLIEDVKNSLIEAYKDSLNYMVSDDELALINLSAADDRKSAIYRYDLEQEPGVFSFFNTISNRDEEHPIPYFSFNDDKLTQLEGYFVSIGDFENNILVYRKQMPINLFKQGKIYIVKGHDTQFERIDKEFLRIDAKLDVLKIDETIIVNNISILERHYEFKDIIEHEANASLENIEGLDILENIEVLQERVDDIAFARKLSKISTSSPVFNLPSEHIMEFVRTHQTLGSAFKYSEDQNRIMLDTKKSQNFFLRLMNDDFLHSQLTDFDYMTPAKDRLN